MSEQILILQKRSKSGKQNAKQLRRDEKVPGIFYFHGTESIAVSMDRKELGAAMAQDSSILKVKLDGSEKNCIIRDVQYDPLDHSMLHVDFMGISMSEKISFTVPIRLTGIPVGVKTEGGMLQQTMREVQIECLPSDIPEAIDLDTSELGVGDSLHLSDIKMDKFKVLGDLGLAVATVTMLRVSEEAPVVVEEEAEAEPEVITKRETKEEE
jgi:large subunit ribosomal protein L25